MLVTLRAEIRKTVDLYCEEPVFREAVLCALARPGFVLHPQARCRAGIFTLEVYKAISGSSPSVAAIQAAVAVELHMQAAYMFDNVADCDMDLGGDFGSAEELAMAIGLLSCGQAGVYEAAYAAGRHGSSLQSLLRWFRDCASSCCAGQFLDAYLEKQPLTTIDEAIKMTSLKAGSLGRFAAGLGASMATDSREMLRLCGDFGFNLFAYLQLVDDLRDACPAQAPQRDLMRHKKTLPLVFFHNSLAEKNPGAVCSIMPADVFGENRVDVLRAFEASGAQVFGAIVAEAFLNRAKGNLTDINNRVATAGNLERFVTYFEINPQEVVACL
jgi:geranylgeranyl pyrophosphate synthase